MTTRPEVREAEVWEEVADTRPPAPRSRASRRSTVVLGAMAVALWVLGLWFPALLAGIACATTMAAIVAAPDARRRIEAVLDRVTDETERALSFALFGTLYVLVVLPVGLVLRVVGRDPLARSLPSTASVWLARHERRPARLLDDRMFADERSWKPMGEARRRGVVLRTVVALLAVQAVLIAAFVVVRDRRDPEPRFSGASGSLPTDSAALRDLPYGPTLFRELAEVSNGLVYTPFVGSSLRDYRGELVNVENRVRRSYEPTIAPGEDVLDVWFFGGSTMFGFDAQRDLHTIPSAFARAAEEAGITVRARNYGSPGFVNYQETVLLSLLLDEGEPPDAVVFYDGINDVSAQIVNAVAGGALLGEPNELGATVQREALASAGALPGGSADPPEPLRDNPERPFTAAGVVDGVVAAYGRGVDLARLLAERHGFAVFHFWQPDIYSKSPLHPDERSLLDGLALDGGRYEAIASVSERIRDELPDGVLDVSGALDRIDVPVLADNVHVNETGAAAVAEAMFVAARPGLVRLSDQD